MILEIELFIKYKGLQDIVKCILQPRLLKSHSYLLGIQPVSINKALGMKSWQYKHSILCAEEIQYLS